MDITIFHCAFIYTGGGERIVLGQYDELVKRGHKVKIYTPVFDPEQCYPDIIGQYPIKTLLPQLPRLVPFRHALTIVLACLLAPLLAWRFRQTDIFIGENQPGAWLAFSVSRVLRKPYIVYLCHPNKMVYPRPHITRKQLWQAVKDFYLLSWVIDWTRPVVAWLDRLSIRSGKKVLVNGYFIGKEVGRVYGVEWEGCPSGSSIPLKYPSSPERSEVYCFSGQAEINGLTIKKPFLLYTGRHEVWKRIDLLIEMLATLVRDYPDVRLVIPGPFTAHTLELQQLATKLDLDSRVLFIGAITQDTLRALYQEAAVYVFSSTMEDFGIVMLEAMGSGTPVVAWRAGGPIDTVIHGQTGYLANPYEVGDFALKVREILTSPNLRADFSRAACEHIAANFSWERHMEVLEKALRESVS